MSQDCDPARFSHAADECLERVTQWLEEFDPDELDYTSADGVLKLEFADGGVFVLNRHTAAQQMWLAAAGKAWHYEVDPEGQWTDTKGGMPLYEQLCTSISTKLGRTVNLHLV